jgi:hypothetical protein
MSNTLGKINISIHEMRQKVSQSQSITDGEKNVIEEHLDNIQKYSDALDDERSWLQSKNDDLLSIERSEMQELREEITSLENKLEDIGVSVDTLYDETKAKVLVGINKNLNLEQIEKIEQYARTLVTGWKED